MSGKYPCSFCCESFVFEKTLQLHKQKIHYDNHETFKTAVTSIGDQVSTNIGRNIKISIGGGESLSKKPSVKKKSNIIKKLCVKRQRVRSSAHQCSECDLKTADYSLLLAHTALEHGPGPRPVFHCGYSDCWFPFPSLAEKREHERARHGALLPPFLCPVCRKRFPQRSQSYTAHVRRCVTRTVYRCPCGPPCNYTTRKFGPMVKHVESRHQKTLSSFPKSSYEVKHTDGDADVKDEPIEIGCDNDGLEDAEMPGNEVGESSETIQCPFDSRKFSKLPSLHKHIHTAHLDTGEDSLDCPFCEETWACFCGRTTNNRDSLVLHSLRCSVLLTSEAALLRTQSDPDQPPDTRDVPSLTARLGRQGRKAARKYKELGFSDRLSSSEKTELDQMNMCKIIGKRARNDDAAEGTAADEIVIENSGDSESEDDSFFFGPSPGRKKTLSPARRKSRARVREAPPPPPADLVWCSECDQTFPRSRVLGHDCHAPRHAPTSVIDLSSDSDIVEEVDGET